MLGKSQSELNHTKRLIPKVMNNTKNLERIERFVNKEMDAQEQLNFETELKGNPQLQQDLEQYNNLIKGINLYSWKQKAKSSYRKYKQFKLLKTLGITAAILALGTASYFAVNLPTETIETEIERPVATEQVSADWRIPKEVFTVNSDKEVVLESKNGTVIAIPKEAFLDENNNTIKGEITFELTEAFDPLDIMKAGLSTLSNDDLLESAGMFLVEAYQNGKALILNPDKPILFEVPTGDKKDGMMLFDAEKSKDGSINWLNTKELDNYLTTVDIHTLNFYPNPIEGMGFEEKLLQLGYQNPSKELKDNIFYSFYCKDRVGHPVRIVESEPLGDIGQAFEVADSTPLSNSSKDKPILPKELITNNNQTFKIDNSAAPIVSWEYIYNTEEAFVGEDFNIEFNAILPKGWSTYGTEFKENVYPIEIRYDIITGIGENTTFTSIGAKKVKDDYLGTYTKFEGQAKYILTVPITNKLVTISGTLYYALCKEGACITSEQAFNFAFNAKSNQDQNSCGIEPSQIRAIWNDKFQNTLLATKEFEQRLQIIYHTCNFKVLDLYINNMDKNLYEIDLMAAKITTGWTKEAFKNFAKEKKGKVKMNSSTLKSLNAYYQKKNQANHKAVKKTYDSYWKKQGELDQEAQNRKSIKTVKDTKRESKNFQKELSLNTKSVYKQLGLTYSNWGRTLVGGRRYQFQINSLGAKNIDRYIYEATKNRASATIKYKGKTATLTYEPIEVQIQNESDFDFVNVYLTTNELTSYMKVKKEGKVYKEKLNDLIDYNLVAIAYKGKQGYISAKNPIVGNDKITLSLEAMSDKELKRMINKHAKSIELRDIKEDVVHRRFLIRDNIRVQKNKNLRNLERELRPIIFPCRMEEVQVLGEYDNVVIKKLMIHNEQ